MNRLRWALGAVCIIAVVGLGAVNVYTSGLLGDATDTSTYTNPVEVAATVTGSERNYRRCSYTLSYTVDGNTYDGTATTRRSRRQGCTRVGATRTIVVDAAHPSTFAMKQAGGPTTALVAVGVVAVAAGAVAVAQRIRRR